MASETLIASAISSGKKKEDEDSGPKIRVVGAGGAGCNAINSLAKAGVEKYAELIAVNTDKKHLQLVSNSAKRVLIGASITRGLGAGGFPELGKKCASISKAELGKILEGTDLLFITAGMGGGTGTGASPVIAEVGKETGAIVVSIVTYPFAMERARLKKAQDGIDALSENSDTLVLIDNNRLMDYAPNLPIQSAFALVDEITTRAVRGIAETITAPSLINLDFSDVKSVMGGGGISMIAVGEASGVDRTSELAGKTLNHRLLDVDCEGATGVLLHITGGEDLTLGDAAKIGESFTDRVDKDANVFWGARMDKNFQGKLEAIAIFTGLKSGYAVGNRKKAEKYSDEMIF